MKRIFLLSLILFIVCCSENAEKWEMKHDEVFEIGDLQLSLDYINKSIALDTSNHRTLFKRGLVYKELKEEQKAIADFNSAVNINPNDIYSLTNLGEIYSGRNDFEQALKYYNQSISIKESPNTLLQEEKHT